MKSSLILILALAGTIFCSCDKTEDPFNIAEENPTDLGGDTIQNQQRVLLEDLTGFRCTNCPSAHAIANNLKNNYGDQLIIVSVHMVDFYAAPTGATATQAYYNDFRTAAGSAYEAAFNVVGIPAGMLNRRNIDGTQILTPGNWGVELPNLLAEAPKAAVNFENKTFNEASGIVSFDVTLNVTEQLDPGPYYMTAYLVEDSIFDWQLSSGVDIENYLHRHVLRDNINGTWGELAFTSGEAGQQKTLSYQYTLDAAWKEEHCEIVAYLYHSDTREIIQVNKTWVMNP